MLKKMMMRKKSKQGLYIHIPFCNKICSYCNFSKVLYSKKFSSLYLEALREELHKYDNYVFFSIYIGGGTPSSLSYDELVYLFEIIKPYQMSDSFITIEVNPDVEYEKISLLKKQGVKRISIGVQSFNSDILRLINRNSDYQKVSDLVSFIKSEGIDDISLDLMYGFNGEKMSSLEDDLKKFVSFGVSHISTYCLQVEDSTVLSIKKYEELDEDNVGKQYDFIVDFLKRNGFNRYEVSNFSKVGYESKHNLIYWNNQEYGGVGLNASSYIDGVRYTNTRNLTEYLKGNYFDYKEELSLSDIEFYFIMLGLRKEEGISLVEYEELFGRVFVDVYGNKVSELLSFDDIEIVNGYLKVKSDKIFILDYILRKLLY